jgi:hypothetical protein
MQFTPFSYRTCSVYQSNVKFCIGTFRPPGVLSQGMDVQRGCRYVRKKRIRSKY